MTCDGREGEERKEGEECDGPGGMSLVPAPHDILQVLLSCCPAGRMQDQCAESTHAGAIRKRWPPCNADHPVVVTRACPLPGTAAWSLASLAGWDGWSPPWERDAFPRPSVPHRTAHVMTRDCCWTSSCRVVVLPRLPRSSLRHSQQLLQLCYHSPAARASSILPLPRFFLSSRSFLSHPPSPSFPSRHCNLNRGTHRPQPPSHKPQPNMPAPQPVQVMDGGMVSRDSGLGAPTVESKSDLAHLSLPTRSTATEPHLSSLLDTWLDVN